MRTKRRSLALAVVVVVLSGFLVAVTIGVSVAAGPGFVQQASVLPQGSAASVTVAMKSAQVVGDLNVVVVGWNGATSSVGTVSDTSGNAYQLAVPVVRGSGLSQAIYFAPNIKAAGAGVNKVSVSFSASVPFPDVRVLEYSGLDPAAPLDGVASGAGSSTSASSGAAVVSASGELVVGAGTTSSVFTGAGSGYTSRVITNPDGDIAEDRVVSVAGSYPATAVVSPSGAWVMQAVAFKPAAGSPPPPPGPAFVQQASVLPQGSAASVTVAMKSAQVVGDLNVVVVGWNGATSSVGTVSDTSGNAYQLAVPVVRGSGLSQAIYFAPNIKAAGAGVNKVSVSFSASVPFPDVRVLEYSGLDPAAPLDGVASGAGSSTSASSGAAVVSASGELVVGAGTTSSVFTGAGSGYTSRVITNPDGDIAEDRVVSVAGSYPATAVVSPSGAWVMQAVAFKPPAGGTTTTTAATTTTSAATTTTTAATTTTTVATTTTTTTGSDPRAVTGAWSAPAASKFIMQHVVLLPGTSKVVFFQDGGGAGTLDPNTGTVVQQPAGYNLFCAGQTVLADGRVFVIGGDASVSPPPSDGSVNTTIYNPGTGTWSATAPMHFLRWYPTATKLPDGRILATSGSNNGCTSCYVPTPEIYNPANNTWTSLPSANQAIPSYPFMFVLPDGRVVETGAFEAPYSVQVLNNPLTANPTWSTVDARVIDAGSAVMYEPGKILRAGSSGPPGSASQTATAAAYTLDMTAPSPSLVPTSSMHNARAFLNLTMLPDGTALATGGEVNHDITQASYAVHAAEVWSPVTGQWTTLASNVSPRYYHSTSVLLPDGRILNGGGWGPGGGTQTNYEIFSPPYLFKGPRPTITSAPSNVTYSSSYTIGTPDAANITKVALIPPAAVTHNFDENNRYVPLQFSVTAGGLQITTPPNANYAPPGPYMLWIVNSNGVPSVARWVNIG